jgi:hypothetical protein
MYDPDKTPRYHAYLLRCWQEQIEGSTPVYRFMIEDAHTHHRRGFHDLASLMAFLHQTLALPNLNDMSALNRNDQT